MMGKVLWTEFFRNRDWPVAAAIAVAAGHSDSADYLCPLSGWAG